MEVVVKTMPGNITPLVREVLVKGGKGRGALSGAWNCVFSGCSAILSTPWN